jgi:hypothetical protein
MQSEPISAWRTHEWRVRTLESIVAGGGSRLGFTCRGCGKTFNHNTINRRTWAVDAQGVALSDDVTNRWLKGECLRHPILADDDDRKLIKYPAGVPHAS